MNGIEIIEQIEVYQIPNSTVIYMIVGVFLILIPAFVVYLITKNDVKAYATELISGIVYLVLLGMFAVGGVFDKPTGEYQYKVKITEDVGYIEFVNRYDVIAENDDGTYVIQEKNN